MNRTATSLAPSLAAAMAEATEEFPPSSDGDASEIAALRVEYARTAEPIGTMPPPPSGKQFARTVLKTVQGKQPSVFLDKLGERLGFERAGTRLYEAILTKYDAYGGFRGGPSRADLEHIFEEEHQHLHLVKAAIEQLGGDPTAVTPSANLHATISMGLPQVVTDPRTDLVQSLEAALVAELADNSCWEALIELARIAGEDKLADQFTQALHHEREHLANVRAWLAIAQGRSGGPRTETPHRAAARLGLSTKSPRRRQANAKRRRAPVRKQRKT